MKIGDHIEGYFLGGKGGWEEVHGRSEYQFPQLELVRDDLEGLPKLCLPSGFELRDFRDGDEEAWGEIMTEAFSPYWSAVRFRRLMRPHFGFRPDRVIFLLRDGAPVGSASAFRWPGVERCRGYVHMLGIKKDHCGAGLGYWLAAACLQRFREQGFRSAMLQTEDFRLPAIKHYLRLGFRPRLVMEAQRQKWRDILLALGGEDLVNEMDIGRLEVMNRTAFWWRFFLIHNYMQWLNFTGELFNR